jgi:uncharacterized membrane protein YqaE (UPF0057 family)
MSNTRPEYDYSNTPAYRRKLRREKLKKSKAAAALTQQGPITSILVGILDIIIGAVLYLFDMVVEFGQFGFGFVLNNIYGTDGKVIPNAEKFGTSMSLKYFRYIITIFIPPLGVFLNKGIYGWFNVILCFMFTYIHFFLGAVYAFVITFRNRYADRYEQVEKMRLDLIKEYVRSCTGEGDQITDMKSGDTSSLIYSVIFFICFFGILYYGLSYM